MLTAVTNLGYRNPGEIDRVFHALGDPTRRAIVKALTDGPRSVSGLASPLDMTLSAVVQHLQVLEESGLVITEKSGRVRTCRLESTGLTLASDWLANCRTMWEQRFDRLGELLNEVEAENAKLETESAGKNPESDRKKKS
ncbi:MAG: metalloregulator ArsR/SmtB family transcription factor [Candidatus Acidiferrales bacterium]